MEIHPKFPDWYRTADLELSETVLEKRTQGLESLLQSRDIDLFLDIIRLFFDRPRYRASSDDEFRKYFQAQDPTFGEVGNEHELRVLAGAAVGVGLSTEDGFRDILALAIRCISLQGQNTDVPVVAILDEAEGYLDQRAMNLRRRSEFLKITIPKLNIEEDLKKLEGIPANQANLAAEPLRNISRTLVEKLTKGMKNMSDAILRHQDVVASQDEELNIMWWVVGGFSRYDDSRLADLSLSEASMRVPFELAALVKLSIGPIASLAYLDSVLRTVDPDYDKSKLSIKQVVDGVGKEWKRKMLTESFSDCRDWIDRAKEFVPVTFALSRSSDGDDQWPSGFATAIGFDPNREMKPLNISYQSFTELLLLRLLVQEVRPS